MRIRSFHLVATFFFGVFASGCVADSLEAEGITNAERAYELLLAEGLTCDCMREVKALNEDELLEFSDLARSSFSDEQYFDLVENRGSDCASTAVSPEAGDVGVVSAAITGTYAVERIEESSSYQGSWGGSSVYRDGAAYGNMCGSDSDYIVEFHSISNAYSNRARLRVKGLTSRGTCLLGWLSRHYVDSRVYSDNDIRSCVGYWGAVWCGAPASGDLWTFVQ